MSRLFLSLAIVSQLSGFAGLTALVCQVETAQPQTCCCHRGQVSDQTPKPDVTPVCPCATAPPLPAPITQTPVTASAARVLVATPAILVSFSGPSIPDTASQALTDYPFAGTGPPLLSVSHLRC